MKLDAYLAREGISKSAFAASIGVSDETIRRYLKGDRKPEWDVLPKISLATGGEVTANDFVDEAA